MPRNDDRVMQGIRFDADLYDEIKARADELGVPTVWLVNKGMRDFLDHMLPVEEIVLTRRTTSPSHNGRAE